MSKSGGCWNEGSLICSKTGSSRSGGLNASAGSVPSAPYRTLPAAVSRILYAYRSAALRCFSARAGISFP